MNSRNTNLDSIEEHKNCRSLLRWFHWNSFSRTGPNYKNIGKLFCDSKWLSMVESKKVDVWIGHLKLDLIFWTIFIKPDHCASGQVIRCKTHVIIWPTISYKRRSGYAPPKKMSFLVSKTLLLNIKLETL